MTWRHWSIVAGVAWLVGFAQFLLVSLSLGLDATSMVFGFLVYGIWALLLGLALLWRPSRAVLFLSIIAAVLLLALYLPILSPPSLSPPDWLSWLPEAVAGIASVVALVAGRSHRSLTRT